MSRLPKTVPIFLDNFKTFQELTEKTLYSRPSCFALFIFNCSFISGLQCFLKALFYFTNLPNISCTNISFKVLFG